jgi:epoxide hydrolase-like predicted phosphatase
MKIKVIYWDLGGVLVRTRDFAPRIALAERLGMSSIELEELVFGGEKGRNVQQGEVTIQKHWNFVQERLQLSDLEMTSFQQEFWATDFVDEDLVEYIRTLRGRFKTCLLSNNFPNLRELITEKWQFADAFDDMVISAEVGVMKPDALALEKMGVAAGESVFVDDFEHNLEGAQRIGMHTVHFRNPAQVKQELEALLERVL